MRVVADYEPYDDDPGSADAPTTRLGFLSGLTRRAAEVAPIPPGLLPPDPAEDPFDFDELPPPGEMIRPALSNDEFLADVDAARQEPGMHLWWLGQSGYLVQVDGEHLLLDPYLSDTLSERFAGTRTPRERVTERITDPGRLAFVDVVASSNCHGDHLDPGTLPLVLARGAALVCPAGGEALAAERANRSPDAVLAPGDEVTIGGFRIEAVRAYHESAPEAVGYVVRNGPFSLYHSGDTRRVRGIAEAVAPHAVDVALVAANGKHGNMNGADAARLAYEAGARLAVPCHFEMFRCDSASPARFVAECVRLGQEYRLLDAGERLTVDL